MPIFDVTGMTCNHCARAVTQSIREIDPEASVKVDLPGGRVEVDSRADAAAIAAAINEAGYGARPAA